LGVLKTLAYYPGCALHSSSREYDLSTREVAKILGISLQEIPGWVCCGASPLHQTEEVLSVALPLYNLSLAKKKVTPQVVVCCAACFNRLKTSLYRVEREEILRKEIEGIIQEETPRISVKHFLEILREPEVSERISSLLVRELRELRVVCYYGCLLVRPPEVMNFDDPENPQILDHLMTRLGATVIDWPFKVDCCGANLSLILKEEIHRLVGRIIKGAIDTGADCIVVACPLCQANLDLKQGEIEELKDIGIPVLYFTQLLGLSLGIPERRLGLNRHRIDPRRMLKELGLL